MSDSKKTSEIFVYLLLTTVLSACKLTVHSGDGGDVLSSTTTRDCEEGNNCVHNITDFTFDEIFTAEPLAGYEFVRWENGMSGQGFLCGGSTNPDCTVSNLGLDGDALAQQIVASNQTFRIAAVFQLATGFLGNTSSSFTGAASSFTAITSACQSGFGHGAKQCTSKNFFESSSSVPFSTGWIVPTIVASGDGSTAIDFSGSSFGTSNVGCVPGSVKHALNSGGQVVLVGCQNTLPGLCCR